jgi:uncharacterized protein (TIGR03067 family)
MRMTVYGYTADGQLLKEDGPFSSDKVTNVYDGRFKIGLGNRCLHLLELVFLTGCTSTSSPYQGELEKLQGNWQLIYQQIDGDKIPDEQAARMFKGRMIFKGTKVIYAADLPGFYFEFRSRIDATKRPHAIDLEMRREGYDPDSREDRRDIGRRDFGIYVLRGDELLICWNDERRPNEFSAAAGTGNTLVVLKRK